ncbi:MAG TPA: COX15/CtaA family protein [Propionibacteriaceae bacterium]|nr:COX15/CtaA family protein [Propionibacteriaceae bacterium]
MTNHAYLDGPASAGPVDLGSDRVGLRGWWRRLTDTTMLRRWSVAALVANIAIVLTGALVRLTASGLGCPTWPRCVPDSYVAQPEYGVHGVIEFGNRLLTFVLAAVMVLTFWCARRVGDRGVRVRVRTWALVLLLGIPLQAVIGGVTVLTQLNPFVVALHLLASMGLIAIAVVLVHRAWGIERQASTAAQRLLVRTTFVLLAIVIWLGTVVTGSGPHAGDHGAARTGYDPALVSHIHAGAVYAAMAATIAGVVLYRSRRAGLLLALELTQGAVGIVQYHLGLPIWLVMLHLLGASLVIAVATSYLLSEGRAGAAQPTVGNR